jgi:hypothetical protein
MPDWLTNLGVGIAAAGAGAYGMYQKVMADSRNNKAADATDAGGAEHADAYGMKCTDGASRDISTCFVTANTEKVDIYIKTIKSNNT